MVIHSVLWGQQGAIQIQCDGASDSVAWKEDELQEPLPESVRVSELGRFYTFDEAKATCVECLKKSVARLQDQRIADAQQHLEGAMQRWGLVDVVLKGSTPDDSTKDAYIELRRQTDGMRVMLEQREDRLRTSTFDVTCTKCTHKYSVPCVPCTRMLLPSCGCGKPLRYRAADVTCPACSHHAGFLERPMWQHIGIGVFNLHGITKLELYSGAVKKES